MPSYVYPTAAEITRINAELDRSLTTGLLGLSLFPRVSKSTYQVRWVQRDNMYGLQQFRGLDGSPAKVDRVGDNTFQYEPGAWGEHVSITEKELLNRADPTNPTQRIDLTQQVMEGTELLQTREIVRQEYDVWQLLQTGTLSIPMNGPNGVTVYSDSYTLQSFNAVVPWSTTATATPLADMQAMQQLSVGHGVDFGADAQLVVNRVQANYVLNNTNAADFGGRRSQYGATLNSIEAFNDYFRGQNLPQLVVYDEGFQVSNISGPITSTSTQFQKYITNGKGVLIGKRRDGSRIGEIHQTINALNPNMAPGAYQFIKDFAQGVNAPKEVPPRIEIHRGWNGGLCLYFQNAIVSASL